MKHELSDMLAASKENPPPPRYTTDDVLAAGRKAQSRRRVLFTGVGSAAAVVAVAAAIAVPQIVTRNSSPTPATNNAPAAASGAKKQAPFAYPTGDFTGNIAPFKIGDLVVSGTVQVTTSYQVATIVAPGIGNRYEDDKGKMHNAVNDAGNVVIYRKGVFSPGMLAKTGTKVSVNGAAAYYVAPKKQPALKPGFPTGLSNGVLAWQYASGSWAVETTNSRAKASKADMINLAQKVTSTTPAELTVDFKLGYVPKGFTLEAAGPSDSMLMSPLDGESFLRVVKGTTSYTGLTEPILDAPVVGDKQIPTLSLAVYPSWFSKHTSKKGMCLSNGESLCYLSTGDGKHVVELIGGGFLPSSELLKVVQNVKFADPADSGTWFKATSAVS